MSHTCGICNKDLIRVPDKSKTNANYWDCPAGCDIYGERCEGCGYDLISVEGMMECPWGECCLEKCKHDEFPDCSVCDKDASETAAVSKDKEETQVFDEGKLAVADWMATLTESDIKKLIHITKWVDLDFLVDVADVQENGAEKYEKDNWKLGAKWMRRINSIFRHALDLLWGRDKDPEMGTFVEAHITTNCMYINYWRRHGKGRDDRK